MSTSTLTGSAPPLPVEQPRTFDSDGYRLRAGCVCLTADLKQILTISSSSRGHWVLPAGGIDPGEDAETAAVRETVEEAGAVGSIAHYLGCFESKEKMTRSQFYVMIAPVLLDRWLEGEQGRIREWVSVEDALTALAGGSEVQLRVIEALHAYLASVKCEEL